MATPFSSEAETVRLLSPENYRQGFLVDEELLGGVTEHPENSGLYVAFVLRHTTGEYLGYQPFHDLEEALRAINRVERPWTYERSSGCGGGNCGKDGGCSGGSCAKKGSCAAGSCGTVPA